MNKKIFFPFISIRHTNGIALLLCISVLLLILCTPSDTITIDKGTLTLFNTNYTRYQMHGDYFYLNPGETLHFSGTSICTTIVNGAITQITTDSLYQRITSLPIVTTVTNNVQTFIYPQQYRSARSIALLDSGITTRYFTWTPQGIYQQSYTRNNKTTIVPVDLQLVLPTPVEVGFFDTIVSINNRWPTSPMVAIDDLINDTTLFLKGYSLGVRAFNIAGEPSHVVNGVTYNVTVQVQTMIAIIGSTTPSATSAQTIGTMMVTSYYAKSNGLTDQTVSLSLQRAAADGSSTLKRIVYRIDRLPPTTKE